MNIKITYNWLLDHLETDADPYEIQKYLSLCGPSVEKVDKVDDDYMFDIEITSNRIDCASVIGIARECQAILPQFGKKAKLKTEEYPVPQVTEKSTSLNLTIEDPDNLVNRVLAIIFDSTQVAPSPEYIRKRLELCDIRSLNNLIDITNYVMLDVGHPTHVFDYDRIKTGKLVFRKAIKGETIITLDDKKYTLDENDVVIDDGTGRIIDLPGIMGTQNSVVTDQTERVLFFLENNHPKVIRKTSMKYGIRSLAATINEKGPDSTIGYDALLMGSAMLSKLAHAKAVSEIFDINHSPSKTKEITISNQKIVSMMGIDIKAEDSAQILKRLEFDVKLNNENLSIIVPRFRARDIHNEEDIIEEVARIYGYHNLPSNLPPTEYIPQPEKHARLQQYELKTKYFLKHHGFNELYSYSMISLQDIKNCQLNETEHLKISNTISTEIEFMRRSLLPSLLKGIALNQGRKDQFNFFEIASVYIKRNGELPEENRRLGCVVTSDFSQLKGYLEALLNEFHISADFLPSQEVDQLSPHIQAKIISHKETVGTIGKVKPEVMHNFGILHDVFYCDIDFDKFIQFVRQIPVYVPVNQYATIKLDMTLQKKPDSTYASIVTMMKKVSTLLQRIEYVSTYEDKITLRCYFADRSKNLTEDEAKTELDRIKNNSSF